MGISLLPTQTNSNFVAATENFVMKNKTVRPGNGIHDTLLSSALCFAAHGKSLSNAFHSRWSERQRQASTDHKRHPFLQLAGTRCLIWTVPVALAALNQWSSERIWYTFTYIIYNYKQLKQFSWTLLIENFVLNVYNQLARDNRKRALYMLKF